MQVAHVGAWPDDAEMLLGASTGGPAMLALLPESPPEASAAALYPFVAATSAPAVPAAVQSLPPQGTAVVMTSLASVRGVVRTTPPDFAGSGSSSGGEGSSTTTTVASPASVVAPAVNPGFATKSGGGSKVPRKKLWKCTYPGCTEPCKTHYNAHSHAWDAHVRHELGADHPLGSVVYKKLPDRDAVKKLCQRYLYELPDETTRKAKRQKKQHDALSMGQTNPQVQ